MDSFTLNKIEFDAVRSILGGFCSTSLGRNLAARIGPSRNPAVVAHWLEQVTQMVRAIRQAGLPPLAGVTDITAQLERVTPGAGAGGEDFAAIAAAIEAAGNVKAYLATMPAELNTLGELAGGIGDFQRELQAIRQIIEPDGTVSDGASEKLSSLRREIAQTAQRIHDVIYGYLRQPEVTKLLQNVTVTLHGDRYVLPVKVENRGRLPGVVHRASNSGATVFVEPNESVELNNRLADLYEDERREVRRLLSELSLRIFPRVGEIASTLRTLAQVDVLSAKAQYAYQFDMGCPQVCERGALVLPQARHPLLIDQAWRQEQAGLGPEKRHPVVPIDVRLGQDFDLLVITGSNTGGKTVALKTVALLAVMAQSGMHIPAGRGATLPVFRDIFIDVGDEQSLQQSLSTFGAHVKRIRYILRKIDQGSLVLLDELGAGTDPDEGGAMGQAVLDELRRIGCLGMVTTHLSVLKAYAMTHERVDNASVEFDVQTLSPTYHLRIGQPGESHAIAVAQKLGMPRRLIGAARQHLNSQGKQFRRAIRSTGQARQIAEDARAQAQAAQLAAETQQEVYQAKLADLHRLQEEFRTWLANLPQLEAGDEVYVPSLKKTGRLVRLELHKQLALVHADNMEVEVPLRELMPDLGQDAVREQIASIRQRILEEARLAEQARSEARRIQEEYQQSLHQHKLRAHQFDNWLSWIARAKVGDEVPIAIRPGKGTLLSMDLPGLKAKVQTHDGELDVSIQDLFPQTGPFARYLRHEQAPRPRPQAGAEQRGRSERPPRQGRQRRREERPRISHAQHAAAAHQTAADAQPHAAAHAEREQVQDDRPMVRRSAHGKAAMSNRQVLLTTQPGDQVYVVPFHKRATLIRVNADKDVAVVQSGIFEMEIPLADLEPIRHAPPPEAPRKKPPQPHAPRQLAEGAQQPAEAQQAEVAPQQAPQEPQPPEQTHQPPG